MSRIVWLFSLVLGHSRHIFARFVMHQDLQTLLRCHMLAFGAIGGVPIEILYDRMKTAVTGEDAEGHIIYNRSLVALGQHYGFVPRACRPYRATPRRGGRARASSPTPKRSPPWRIATELLDRLLHHAVVIQIEGSSYRLRQHAGFVPEHLRAKPLGNPPLPPKRRGRPPARKTDDRESG